MNPAPDVPSTLIVGAGLTGCLLAAALARRGLPVQLLDKARGPGGRMSVRRTDSGSFAHGCPPRAWSGGSGEEAKALPGLPRSLLAGVATRFNAQVARMERVDGRWRLLAADGELLGEGDRIVLTAPAPQSANLLADLQPEWSQRLRGLQWQPGWSLMLALPSGHPDPEWAAAGDWLASVEAQQDEGSDAPAPACDRRWVLRLADGPARRLLEDSPEHVLQQVLARLGATALPWRHPAAHRWRYARVLDPLPEPLLSSEPLQLAVCGDAFAAEPGRSDLERCRASAEAWLQRLPP